MHAALTVALSCVIFEIKRDISRKSRFFIPPVHSTPSLRSSRRNIVIPFGIEKLDGTDGEKSEDMFSRFDN